MWRSHIKSRLWSQSQTVKFVKSKFHAVERNKSFESQKVAFGINNEIKLLLKTKMSQSDLKAARTYKRKPVVQTKVSFAKFDLRNMINYRAHLFSGIVSKALKVNVVNSRENLTWEGEKSGRNILQIVWITAESFTPRENVHHFPMKAWNSLFSCVSFSTLSQHFAA